MIFVDDFTPVFCISCKNDGKRMQAPANQSKAWRKTNVANLYVHRNGGYYFRVTVGRKQIWESLHTKLKGVAEAASRRKAPCGQNCGEDNCRSQGRKAH